MVLTPHQSSDFLKSDLRNASVSNPLVAYRIWPWISFSSESSTNFNTSSRFCGSSLSITDSKKQIKNGQLKKTNSLGILCLTIKYFFKWHWHWHTFKGNSFIVNLRFSWWLFPNSEGHEGKFLSRLQKSLKCLVPYKIGKRSSTSYVAKDI